MLFLVLLILILIGNCFFINTLVFFPLAFFHSLENPIFYIILILGIILLSWFFGE
jgi:hypothetical protein